MELGPASNGGTQRVTDSPDTEHRDPIGAARHFGRRRHRNLATYFPRPQRRTGDGDLLPRHTPLGPSIPSGDSLLASYEEALAVIREVYPLRASRLQDLMSRVKAGEQRYLDVYREEEERRQNYNEEVRRHDHATDERLKVLRAELAELRRKHDQEIDTLRAERETARREVAETWIRAGLASGGVLAFSDDDPEPHVKDSSSSTEASVGGRLRVAGIALPSSFSVPRPLKDFFAKIFRPRPKAGTQVSVGELQIIQDGQDSATSEFWPPSRLMCSGTLLPERPEISEHEAPSWDSTFREAMAMSKPLSAIAADLGLPTTFTASGTLATSEPPSRWCQIAELLGLVACGGIFGLSTGLVTGLLDWDAVATGRAYALAVAGVTTFLGVFIFWLIGRVVYLLAQIASEDLHQSALASYCGEAGASVRVSGSLLRRAVWGLVVLLLGAAALVVVEATVERYGIIQQFVTRNFGGSLIGGMAHSGVPQFAILALVLTVSLPYVLYHICAGWRQMRDCAVIGFLRGFQTKDAWERAHELFNTRAAVADAAAAQARDELQAWSDQCKHLRNRAVEMRWQQVKEHMQSQVRTPLSAPSTPSESTGVRDPEVGDIQEGGSTASADIELAGNVAIRPTSSQTNALIDAAIAYQRASEAHFKVRSACARKQEDLAPLERRIEELEKSRLTEQTELSPQALARCEDAYGEMLAATAAFDREYERVARMTERRLRPGLLRRIRAALTWTEKAATRSQ